MKHVKITMSLEEDRIHYCIESGDSLPAEEILSGAYISTQQRWENLVRVIKRAIIMPE